MILRELCCRVNTQSNLTKEFETLTLSEVKQQHEMISFRNGQRKTNVLLEACLLALLMNEAKQTVGVRAFCRCASHIPPPADGLGYVGSGLKRRACHIQAPLVVEEGRRIRK